MKKLMMAIAAVFAVASIASAVDIKWGSGMTATDNSGDPMSGGAAYLIYLGDNGTLDATFADGAWTMGDDTVVSSATIISAPATSSSTGMFTGAYNTSNPKGSVYSVLVTSDGTKGNELPTTGYYGFSPTYAQQKDGVTDTETITAASAGFSSVAAATEMKSGGTPVIPTPEPTTYALVGLAVAALALRKRLGK